MKTYFLSYARADEKVALRFADDLIAAGVQLWVDQYDIRPSEHWDRAVETAVRNSQGLVVMLSPRSAASPNVADEVSVAIEGGKSVIPILIEGCTIPLRMTRMQFIDATSDYAGALRRCLSTIHRNAEADPPAEATPAPPAMAPLAPQDMQKIVTALARHLGPIAPVVVSREMKAAQSTQDLCQRLAARVPSDRERAQFLTEVRGL
jgi:hypothetical protein